jgi:hypothetical protein
MHSFDDMVVDSSQAVDAMEEGSQHLRGTFDLKVLISTKREHTSNQSKHSDYL